jgi:hypothetical protein
MEESDTNFHITSKLTYDATLSDGKPATRPITFHDYAVPGSFSLYRRIMGAERNAEKHWLEWQKLWRAETNDGYMLVDGPAIRVTVGNHDTFRQLLPDESWEAQHAVSDFNYEGNGVNRAGDEMLFRFDGVTVDWWDWGSKMEHAETFVYLPSFIAGRVLKTPNPTDRPCDEVEKSDNGGRPRLEIELVDLEFRVVADREEQTDQKLEIRSKSSEQGIAPL